jgi:hypothetical protein
VPSGTRRPRAPGAAAASRCREGSVALSLCTTVHPLHIRFANVFGASVFEATVRPDPRLAAASGRCWRAGSCRRSTRWRWPRAMGPFRRAVLHFIRDHPYKVEQGAPTWPARPRPPGGAGRARVGPGAGARGAAARVRAGAAAGARPHRRFSEADAKLAQKLGQLQPFAAVSHRNAWANLRLLGQPNTVLAYCTSAHSLHTRSPNITGASLSEAAARPGPADVTTRTPHSESFATGGKVITTTPTEPQAVWRIVQRDARGGPRG